MGTSKSYKEGPGWEDRNTPGADSKISKGSKSAAEGTHMSGEDDWGRKGMSNTARKKSSSGETPYKTKTPAGQS